MSGIFRSDENKPPSPPPAPPLPPPHYGHRAANALARIARPFIYASRPPSAHGDRPSSANILPARPVTQRSSSPTASRNTSHKTGLPINAFDISPARTHAILAGREILKTIHVTESACTEDFNLRSSIIAYAAAHDSSGGTISARHKDQLAATDVKWSHGRFDATIATAAASGQIVIYDINRAGVELARLHEHSRQVHRLAFNPYQAALLLSGSQDATVRLWDLRALARDGSVMTCQSAHKYPGNSEGIRDLQWSPTEGVEFALGTDTGVVQRWDLRNPGAPLLKINAHEKTCYSVDWHQDGKHLASAGGDKSVKIWDFSSTDRRMKVCWQVRAPKPALNVRWRPSSWRAQEGSTGCWYNTHLATSYDNQDPRIHVWDLRRPSVPSREIDRYETAATALLWRSESLLWSVGVAGMFTQTDINFTKRVLGKQSPSTMAIAPDGAFALFLEDRSTKQTNHSYLQRNKSRGGSGEKLSSSYSATEGSLEEPGLLSSSFKARRRKTPSIKSSRSLAGTPPSGMNEGLVLDLDEALRAEYLFRPGQTSGYGRITGVFEGDAFTFLACNYRIRPPRRLTTGKATIESLSNALEENATLAAYVGRYRLAQSWRILSLMLQKELEARYQRNAAHGSSLRKQSITDKETVQPQGSISQKSRQSLKNGGRPVTKPIVPISLNGGSNMTTPLARPIPDAIVDSGDFSGRDGLDAYDSLELPEPKFRKRSPQKPTEVLSELSRLRSPKANGGGTERHSTSSKMSPQDQTDPFRSQASQTGGQDSPDNQFFDIDRHMSERRAAMENYRTIPRPVLRLEGTIPAATVDPRVPRLDRHDSNESFQMFSASTDSSHRARSLMNSFGSSHATGSSGPISQQSNAEQSIDSQRSQRPSSPDDIRNSPNRLRVPRELEKFARLEDTELPEADDGKHIKSTTRIVHEQVSTAHEPKVEDIEVEENDKNADGLDEVNLLPSSDDPPPAPWTATALLRPLIDYHTIELCDVQLPAHLLLLLDRYIENDLPDALVSSIMRPNCVKSRVLVTPTSPSMAHMTSTLADHGVRRVISPAKGISLISALVASNIGPGARFAMAMVHLLSQIIIRKVTPLWQTRKRAINRVMTAGAGVRVADTVGTLAAYASGGTTLKGARVDVLLLAVDMTVWLEHAGQERFSAKARRRKRQQS
ncbi:MAG: hypothetical protein Q9220_002724 [cf. Caloplaca sp. 1 TL-2023]